MAVSALFVEGTIGSSATVTIQPASGTVYTFKRGKAIKTAGSGNFMVGNPYSSLNVSTYAFSEGGLMYDSGTPAQYTGSNYFSALSNSATAYISTSGTSVTGVAYVLVGVSMT